MDGPAAGQPNGERLIIGVAKGDRTPLPRLNDVERLGHNSTLDATPRDRTCYFAIFVNGHGSARKTGP